MNFRFRLTRESLEYYVTLQSESHREAWTAVLILIFTKFLKLNEERVKLKRSFFLFSILSVFLFVFFFFFKFKYFSGEVYHLVAEAVVFDLKPELRYMLREYLLRVGRVFHVHSETLQSTN